MLQRRSCGSRGNIQRHEKQKRDFRRVDIRFEAKAFLLLLEFFSTATSAYGRFIVIPPSLTRNISLSTKDSLTRQH